MSVIKGSRFRKMMSCFLCASSVVPCVLNSSNIRTLAKGNNSVWEVVCKSISDFVLKSKEGILYFWNFVLDLAGFDDPKFSKLAKYMYGVEDACNTFAKSKDFALKYRESFNLSENGLGFSNSRILQKLVRIGVFCKGDSKDKEIREELSLSTKDGDVVVLELNRSKEGGRNITETVEFKIIDGVLWLDVVDLKLETEKKYLPLSLFSCDRTMLKGSGTMSVRILEAWRDTWFYLDPFFVFKQFFNKGVLYEDGGIDAILTRLKSLLTRFKDLDKDGKMKGIVERAIRVFDSLGSCLQKLMKDAGLDVEALSRDVDETFYRKKMLKIIFSKNPPEGCRLKDFEELKGLVTKYLKFIGAFDKESSTGLRESDFYTANMGDQSLLQSS